MCARLFFASMIALCAVGAFCDEIPDQVQGMPLVYKEDFSGGAANWQPTDPKAWAVQDENGNKVYALTGASDYEPPVRSPKNISLINDFAVGDFVLEAKVKQTGREYGHRDFCVFFGHNDPSHFYYLHLASKADPHAHSIFLVNGVDRVSIAKERTDGVKWDDQYHTVRIVRNTESGLIQVFFDDMSKPIMSAEDKTFTLGKIGFGSFDDTGIVDDVRIWGKKIQYRVPASK